MYLTIEIMKQDLTTEAKERLLYMQNTSDNSSLSNILNVFFDNSISVLTNWLKFDDNIELLTGKYNVEIVNFMVNSHNDIVSYNDNKKKLTPDSTLKSSVAQRI